MGLRWGLLRLGRKLRAGGGGQSPVKHSVGVEEVTLTRTLGARGALGLVLRRSRQKGEPLGPQLCNPEPSTSALAGVVQPDGGETGGNGEASNAKEPEMIEWEGQPSIIEHDSEIAEMHPVLTLLSVSHSGARSIWLGAGMAPAIG